MKKVYKIPLLSSSLLLFIIFVFSSCVKEEYNFENINPPSDFTPGLAGPGVYGSIKLSEVLPDTEGEDFYIETDANNLLHLRYQSVLDTFTLNDLDDFIPDSDTASTFYSGSTGTGDFLTATFNSGVQIQLYDTIEFEIEPDPEQPDQRFDEVKVSEGWLVVEINSEFPYDGDFIITFPTATKGTDTLKYIYTDGTSNSNGIDYIDSVDMAGYTVTTTDNTLPVYYDLSMSKNGRNIADGESIQGLIYVNNLKVSEAYGYLDQISYEIENDTIDLSGLSDKIIEDSHIHLADPQLKLLYENSFGIPMRFTPQHISAYDENDTEIPVTGSAVTDPKDIGSPANVGDPVVTDSILFNNSTTNLLEVLQDFPSYMTFGGEIITNPDGSADDTNFATENSSLIAKIDVDIPLDIELADFVFEDTIEFNVSEDISELDDFNNKLAIVQSWFNNGFPLELEIQGYLVDSNYIENPSPQNEIIDSLFTEGPLMLQGAETDANGTVTSPTPYRIDITMNDERVEKLKDVRLMILKVEIQTPDANPDGPHKHVKLLSTYGLDFKFSVKAKATISEENLE